MLKRLGGLGVLAAGGVGGATLLSSDPAAATANVDFTFESKTLQDTDEKKIDDVLLNGAITGGYKAPNTEVTAVTFKILIEWREKTMSDERTLRNIDTTEQQLTIEPQYSLVDDLGFDPGMLNASHEEGVERSYDFDAHVTFIVRHGADEAELVRAKRSATSTLTIKPEQDPKADVETLLGGRFEFAAQTSEEES